ncbi:hypothetical protein [Pedobacter xixiisoli]|uniref:Mannose-6-phosphate isomerase, cupin superfamily n=1 Tax=Pedobacter xixiisoli TaxID=1476464 RepID=A0A286A9Q9_9SPHI|nr:hypothetical protein [Pedobacter xixiisoli]SOD18646.1 Mannose-6-phosphate isomerase, cupin superfamily [Pedobacter xixiisoli]
MIENISYENHQLAIIIRSNYKNEGIEFFTPPNYSQQLAYMNRSKGYIIAPHKHKKVERMVMQTQEVLFIKSGKVKIDFYSPTKAYFTSTILEAGDVILLADGGHGFEMMEDTEMIEVKQGPYSQEDDKEFLNSSV